MKEVTIVVSRFNESLEWLQEILQSLKTNRDYVVYVYNKGPNHVEIPADWKLLNLGNVGRESHTYLTHIVKHFEDCILTPSTIFLMGSLNSNLERLNLAKEVIHGVLVAGKNTAFPSKRWTVNSNFILDNHKSLTTNNNILNPSTQLTPASLRPFGKWYQKTFSENIPSRFTIAGTFAASRTAIASIDIDTYKKVLEEASIGPNLEIAHFLERSWLALYSGIN